MWDMGDGVDRELRSGSWTSLARVDVLHDGRPVASLAVADGQSRAEAGRSVLRSLAATLVDPTGRELTTGDVRDLLDPYECELAAWRGVQLMDSSTLSASYAPNARHSAVWAPLGVFRLTDRQLTGDGAVEVIGQDRAIVYQGPLISPLPIDAGTPVEEAIYRLLSARNPGVVFAQTWITGFTVGPLLFPADSNVWAEAQTLAKSVGGWLYHDRLGGLNFASILPTSDRPVMRFADEPGGRLVRAERSEDSDTIRNVVNVVSAKAGLGGVIQAVVADTDPASPTYARGRYGWWPVTVSNQHVGSLEQAQQMGAAELARRLGRSETVNGTVVTDMRLDPLDVVTIHRPSAGLEERGMVIASLATPLRAAEMPLGLHRSIRAQDGRIVDVPLELAA